MPTRKRVDFKELRERVTIEQACSLLGVVLKKSGMQLRGACPICANGSDRCFVVTPVLNRFWCFGDCKSGGDVIELVAQARKLSHKDAAKLLADQFGEGS